MSSFPPLFLGIDPGSSGGIAVVSNGVVEASAMPETERDICDLLEHYRDSVVMAYIEALHPMPKSMMGMIGAFKLGMSYGQLRGMLIATRIPFTEVYPGKWKKAMGLVRGKDESKTDYKNRSKALAQQLFSSLKITHAVAESLLLAEYGRRQTIS